MDNISIRLMFVVLLMGVGNGQLSRNFYDTTCPDVFRIIEHVVNDAVRDDRRMGASLLRLHFHDCFVHGCDASVLLDDRGNFIGEKTAAPNNNSLRGFHVIDDIKAEVEWWCPGVVSCADILAVAARVGVVALGGPGWMVPMGRRDSTTASRAAANSELPGPSSSLSNLIIVFSNKGFSPREMVALSGAHTIGKARCVNFRHRLYNDDNINDSYAFRLEESCPRTRPNGDNNLSPLDGSPTVFNNDYYKDLRSFMGLLHSDQELFNGGSTDAQVRGYSTNSESFFHDFANAMVKMSSIAPLTGTNGQIRRHCRRTN